MYEHCFAGKLLAYNCSPSFNWKRHLDDATIAKFQQEIGKMGYKFQFVTLAGFHSLNHAMFELSAGYAKRGMAAYSELQQLEFASESKGYTCSKHQREVCAYIFLSTKYSGCDVRNACYCVVPVHWPFRSAICHSTARWALSNHAAYTQTKSSMIPVC